MNPVNQATIKRRKITPETRAGQYMCPECGKIFETKKEVDTHTKKKHDNNFRSTHKGHSNN